MIARFGCLPMHDALARHCDCQAKPTRHPAHFHAEVVDPGTGEIKGRDLCIPAARAFATKYALEYPPGMWAS